MLANKNEKIKSVVTIPEFDKIRFVDRFLIIVDLVVVPEYCYSGGPARLHPANYHIQSFGPHRPKLHL